MGREALRYIVSLCRAKKVRHRRAPSTPQARSRMVMSYFMAQLMPWATDGDETTAGGSLLVLGSANVDEALR